MSLVRRKYWITKPRSLINKVLKGCFTCRRLYAQPEQQRMADLVEERIIPGQPPFTYVGVDCFGYFLVKRGRSQEKRYGCMFTCLTIRAVHMERLTSLETSSFINALVRFIARHGNPKQIRSDNGTNFVGADRELRNAVKQLNKDPILRRMCLQREIEWVFNPPAASRMGGAWERQIRSARKILLAMLPEHSLDDDKLETLLCEVEGIINGRPLIPLSNDPNDLETLTPNHLLQLRSGPVGPPGIFSREDMYGKRWRHVQHLADLFWTRWVKEYIPSIITHGRRWTGPVGESENQAGGTDSPCQQDLRAGIKEVQCSMYMKLSAWFVIMLVLFVDIMFRLSLHYTYGAIRCYINVCIIRNIAAIGIQGQNNTSLSECTTCSAQ